MKISLELIEAWRRVLHNNFQNPHDREALDGILNLAAEVFTPKRTIFLDIARKGAAQKAEIIREVAKVAEMTPMPSYGTHARVTGRQEAKSKIVAAILALCDGEHS